MEGADWEGRPGVRLLEEGLFLALQEAGGHRRFWGPRAQQTAQRGLEGRERGQETRRTTRTGAGKVLASSALGPRLPSGIGSAPTLRVSCED